MNLPIKLCTEINKSAPITPDVAALEYISSLSRGSIRAVRARLDCFARILGTERWETTPWHELTPSHLQIGLRALEEGGKSPATIAAILSAIKGVSRKCFEHGLMSEGQYARIGIVKPPRGERIAPGRLIADDEVRALLATCDDSRKGIRDRALLWLLYSCGLRRSEAVGLQWGTVDIEAGWIKVEGKGRKWRQLYPCHQAMTALEVHRFNSPDTGPVFCNLHSGAALTDQAVYVILNAKHGGRPLSPHDFRRTLISRLLEQGTDIVTAQKIAGHANPATTASYDRRGEDGKRSAMGKIRL